MKLKHVNTGLFIAIVLVLTYVIVAPLLPLATFWVEQHTTARLQQLSSQVNLPVTKIAGLPSDNRLVIPAALLSEPISEGSDLRATRTGPWRRPNGSTPDKGGNTIIVGHRFTYTNPRGTFYALDKVRVHDKVAVFWQDERYIYTVTNIQVVPPTDIAIEAPTADVRLTLYTCTPLWLPKDRLVVTAELDQKS